LSKPRKLTTPLGTVTLRRPRVRGLEERADGRILPLFARRTKEVGELLPELYLHGLAEGDFDLALRGLLGEEAPLSAQVGGPAEGAVAGALRRRGGGGGWTIWSRCTCGRTGCTCGRGWRRCWW
jgi:hypothetical protein